MYLRAYLCVCLCVCAHLCGDRSTQSERDMIETQNEQTNEKIKNEEGKKKTTPHSIDMQYNLTVIFFVTLACYWRSLLFDTVLCVTVCPFIFLVSHVCFYIIYGTSSANARTHTHTHTASQRLFDDVLCIYWIQLFIAYFRCHCKKYTHKYTSAREYLHWMCKWTTKSNAITVSALLNNYT